MSYITQLQQVFLNIKPNGTFIFESEVRQQVKSNDLASISFPMFIILDDIQSNARIEPGADWDESPTIKGYVLSKYDSLNNEITFDKTRLEKHDGVVWLMKQLAADVIARFFIEYQYGGNTDPVVRLTGDRPTPRFIDVYDKYNNLLHGVYFEFTVKFKRVIDYEPNS